MYSFGGLRAPGTQGDRRAISGTWVRDGEAILRRVLPRLETSATELSAKTSGWALVMGGRLIKWERGVKSHR